VRPPARYAVTESNLDTALRYETVVGLLADRWRPELAILEVGAGSAGITEFLAHPVTGVDTDFERTSERSSALLRRVQATADAMPFANASFDVVISLEMLEHIAPERREASLREMLRVLRPGGRMIVSFPADASAARLDRWLNARFRRVSGFDHPWAIEHIEHGVPATADVVEPIERILGLGSVRVRRHMSAASFRLVHGLHTRPAVRILFALCRRAHGEPAYRSILVADKPLR
jgi:SAM-dependent methyltransferase